MMYEDVGFKHSVSLRKVEHADFSHQHTISEPTLALTRPLISLL